MDQRVLSRILSTGAFALLLATTPALAQHVSMPGITQNIEDIEAQEDVMVTLLEIDMDSVRCLTRQIMENYGWRVNLLSQVIGTDFVTFLASRLTEETAAIDAKIFKTRLQMALHRLSEKPPCPTPEEKSEKTHTEQREKTQKRKHPRASADTNPQHSGNSGSAPATNFFQAEDGIRDYKVTGVQACALPL